MRERSAEEQPPKLKTYRLEMTLIKLFRNYTMYSSCSRHPLQPRLRIIPANPIVEDGDAKPVRALQCEQRRRNCKSKTYPTAPGHLPASILTFDNMGRLRCQEDSRSSEEPFHSITRHQPTRHGQIVL